MAAEELLARSSRCACHAAVLILRTVGVVGRHSAHGGQTPAVAGDHARPPLMDKSCMQSSNLAKHTPRQAG